MKQSKDFSIHLLFRQKKITMRASQKSLQTDTHLKWERENTTACLELTESGNKPAAWKLNLTKAAQVLMYSLALLSTGGTDPNLIIW